MAERLDGATGSPISRWARRLLISFILLAGLYLSLLIWLLAIVSILFFAPQWDPLVRIFPSLCPAGYALPDGVFPRDCMNGDLPGGLWLETSADMTEEQMHEFVETLFHSQQRRFVSVACDVRGFGTTAYVEVYDGALVEVLWSNGVMHYLATDHLNLPCDVGEGSN